MGYASYLEDILKALDRDLLGPLNDMVRNPSGAKVPIDVIARCKAYLDTAEVIKRKIERLLDLATDPNFDLAARVQEVDRLENRIHDLEKRVQQLEEELGSERRQKAKLQKELRRLEKEYEDLLLTEPAAFSRALIRYSEGTTNKR